jgi:glycosyltransferase involved in cell wall biosynthesis
MRRLIAWFYQQFFRRSSAPVIADSEFLASLFRTHYRATNIAVVEIGIDHDRFYPTPSHELTSSKMGRKSILILARSDTYRKGGDIGERVLRRLCQSDTDRYEIWTVGSASVTLPPGVRVRRFGSPSDDDLRPILSSADVLFYPSRHEGFGLFPLEAMACGCPVVTTTAVPYATDGENAYVAFPEDTTGLVERLTRVLLDEPSAHGIRRRGREFALGYDIRKSEREFESTLRVLIHRGDAPSTQ